MSNYIPTTQQGLSFWAQLYGATVSQLGQTLVPEEGSGSLLEGVTTSDDLNAKMKANVETADAYASLAAEVLESKIRAVSARAQIAQGVGPNIVDAKGVGMRGIN